jgi:hypothetical protein
MVTLKEHGRRSRIIPSLQSNSIQCRNERRLRDVHTCNTTISPPSLVQQVWWRGRWDVARVLGVHATTLPSSLNGPRGQP